MEEESSLVKLKPTVGSWPVNQNGVKGRIITPSAVRQAFKHSKETTQIADLIILERMDYAAEQRRTSRLKTAWQPWFGYRYYQ